MISPARGALTWICGLLLLAAPLFVVGALLYPSAVRFAEPVLCGDGLTLTTDVGDPDTPLDNRAKCESETRMVDVTDRVVMIGIGAAVLAIAGYLLRNWIEPPRLAAPHSPRTH